MSKLTVITDRALERALELAHTAGDGLKSAGGSLRNADWIKTGAAIGAVKTGGKAATKFVRRNPAVAVAAAAVGVVSDPFCRRSATPHSHRAHCALVALDRPRGFPLGYFVARSFVAERLALIGDAAHVIHPIAGQGLNMGLKDVAALAEVVVDAARLGMDLGQADVLERYQRWRRFDTMAMGVATNSLNFLFSNESTLLRTVRDIGLGLVDRAPPLKSMFIRQAAGLSGEVPRLLKGEAL